MCKDSPWAAPGDILCLTLVISICFLLLLNLVSMFSFHYNAMSLERMKRRQSEEGICLSYCLRGMKNVSLLVTAALSPVSFSPPSILVQSAPASTCVRVILESHPPPHQLKPSPGPPPQPPSSCLGVGVVAQQGHPDHPETIPRPHGCLPDEGQRPPGGHKAPFLRCSK